MRGSGRRRWGGIIRVVGRLVSAAALCLPVSCFGVLSDLQELNLGGLTIRVTEEPFANIVPQVDMTVARYDACGTGPDGATFHNSFTGGSLTQQGLAFGDWTIVVEGRNRADRHAASRA